MWGAGGNGGPNKLLTSEDSGFTRENRSNADGQLSVLLLGEGQNRIEEVETGAINATGSYGMNIRGEIKFGPSKMEEFEYVET